MKKKSVKWIRDENGAVIVLVALALTVLLGMSALAVDYGSLVVAKSELQNAADAAALAGARALIDGDSMPAAVVAMCADNNCDTADGATVTSAQGTHNGKRTVTVTVTKPVNMSFSQVLTGKNTGSVTATATAETANIFDNYKYAMFATEDITDSSPTGITINGNNVVLMSDIHSNSRIKLNWNQVDMENGAQATSVSAGTGVHVDMPSIESLLGVMKSEWIVCSESYLMNLTGSKSASQFTITTALLNTIIDDAGGYSGNSITLYFDTTATVAVQHTSYYCAVNIVTDGPLTFYGNANLTSGHDEPVVLITTSTSGATFNGSGISDFYGILYAPYGNVTINGKGATYHGSIIAENITINGGKVAAVYDETVDDNLPDTKVRLID